MCRNHCDAEHIVKMPRGESVVVPGFWMRISSLTQLLCFFVVKSLRGADCRYHKVEVSERLRCDVGGLPLDRKELLRKKSGWVEPRNEWLPTVRIIVRESFAVAVSRWGRGIAPYPV